MSADNANENVAHRTSCVHMESVDRIVKLPVVETTIETATNIYGKVKEFNGLTNWTLSTAESTANKVVEVGKPYVAPVVQKLEGPIKTVDGLLCSGLDYVEAKVPAVKLPPGEMLLQMYQSTKNCVNSTVECTVQKAYNVVDPAVQTAKNVVEPLVQPAVDKAKEFLHQHQRGDEGNKSTDESESAECDNNKKEN